MVFQGRISGSYFRVVIQGRNEEQQLGTHEMSATLDVILDGLMSRYSQRVPDVARLMTLLIDRKIVASADRIDNDHVAFRTMGVTQLGIQSLEAVFLHHGYTRKDAYQFKQKKLDAFWYSPPDPKYPRIFISELRVGDLSDSAQAIIRSYTDEVTHDPVKQLDLDDGSAVDDFLHSPLWRTPTWQDFQTLLSESEYAAWVIYNRYYLNHFTVSVHNLPSGFNTVEKFNRFLEGEGFRLNDSGGKIKTSRDGLLQQSSTVAAMTQASFDDGNGGTETHEIAGSYVEFACRGVLPEFQDLPSDQVGREHRRDGFEASNADKIFESTYRTQTKKDE